MGLRHRNPAVVVYAAAGLSAAILSGLVGCSTGDGMMKRFIDTLTGDPYALSEEGRRELQRFNVVYAAYVSEEQRSRPLDHFREAFKRVRATYVRELSDASLIDSAISGLTERSADNGQTTPSELVEASLDSMIGSLDPHSAYFNADEFRENQLSTKGEFGGLGIEVTFEDGAVKVVSPIEDTPAFRAGVQPGDRITHVDGEPLADKDLMYAVLRMRGEPGTSVLLTIERAGSPPFDVSITRAQIRVRAVRWRIEGSIGYVRVVRFTEKMEDGVEGAIDHIRKALGSNLAGLVLDLRNNPGGLLDQSLILADAFLDDGVIVTVRGRRSDQARVYAAEEGDLAEGVPMVVLINAGSASASEIVAGALQDHGRATVMGVRSFGKGSVQTITPLPREGALKLTTALYYAPSGRTIQARGIEPDFILAPEEAGEESQTQRESDLPRALPAKEGPSQRAIRRTVPEKDCTPVGERSDRQLGCALAFLKAGSAARFLAQPAGPASM